MTIDLADLKENVETAANLLLAVAYLLPGDVKPSVIEYLQRVANDETGLKMLRSSLELVRDKMRGATP